MNLFKTIPMPLFGATLHSLLALCGTDMPCLALLRNDVGSGPRY